MHEGSSGVMLEVALPRVTHLPAGSDVKSSNAGLCGHVQMELFGVACRFHTFHFSRSAKQP